jgi:rod shape-determining protein MreD
MKNGILKQLSWFVGIMLSQVLVFNNIELFSYLNPYIYPIFVLSLNAKTSRGGLLFWGFISGFIVDLFEDTGGIHSFATTLIGFLRPRLLRIVATQGGEEFDNLLLTGMGIRKFVTYGLISLWVHHFALYLLDGLSLRSIGSLIIASSLNAVFSFLVILLAVLFITTKKAKR